MILVDTSGVLAALGHDQRSHEDCVRALARAEPPLLLSPFVLAELDYLVTRQLGARAAMVFLGEVAERRYTLEPFDADDVGAARKIAERHLDLGIGLADASIAVLAARHRCADVLTLDQRHFRVVPAYADQPFRVLPADR